MKRVPLLDLLRLETSKAIVAVKYMIDRLLLGLLARDISSSGVPGLAKTLAIKPLQPVWMHASQDCSSRLTCCPPIPGTLIYNQKEAAFEVRKGPIFCQIPILADEIKPGTRQSAQSALLEAMQEKTG